MLLSVVFIVIQHPLKNRGKLTRFICSSTQGKDRVSSANTLKRGLGEAMWIRCRPTGQPCVLTSFSSGTRVFWVVHVRGFCDSTFVRGCVHFSLGPLADVQQEEMPRLERGQESFWL